MSKKSRHNGLLLVSFADCDLQNHILPALRGEYRRKMNPNQNGVDGRLRNKSFMSKGPGMVRSFHLEFIYGDFIAARADVNRFGEPASRAAKHWAHEF
jgi:hypothetical protein